MQEVVARTLLETPALAAALGEFDCAVLRTRDKGRRAKELVKRRLDANPVGTGEQGLDTAALLELARGQTGRDAEWALGQLARRAAAGEAVAGLTVDGVGGI